MAWMVVQTEPQREQLAQKHIQLSGREAYLPRFRDWRSGKIKSLYPSYLFVGYDEFWHDLRRTVGVVAPILIDGVPGRVPDDHIDDLQGRQDSDGLIFIDLDIGHVVTVVTGEAMLGWTGLFDGMADRDRCNVLFSIMGLPVCKVVNTKDVRAESLYTV